jgi:hypothetical protein
MTTQGIAPNPPERNVVFDTYLPRDMRDLANRIRPHDSDATKRLEEIANQLPDQQNQDKPIDHLATINPYDVINPDAIERHAAESSFQHAGWFGCLEMVRNFLVLMPILITWIALSIASHNYAETVAMVPDKAGAPFLLLWEQGFPVGTFTWLRFSWVAGADFLIIALVIGLTIFFHYATEVHSQQVKKTAQTLRKDLDHVLWRLALALAHGRREQDPNQLAAHLSGMARRLETERDHLHQLNTQVADNTRLLSDAYRSFEKERADFLTQIGGLTQTQTSVVAKMAENITQVEAATVAIKTSLQGVSADLRQAVDAARQAADVASNGFTVAQKAVESAESTTQSVERVGQQLGTVVNHLGAVTNTLAQTNQSLESNANETKTLNQQLGQVNQNVNAVASNIGAIPGSLQGISASLQTSAQQTADTARATAGLLHPLGTLVAQLPTVSQGMQNVANNLDRTSQAMAQSVGESANLNRVLQQTAQAFPQGVQQMAQQFAQGVIDPLKVQAHTIQSGLASQANAFQTQLNNQATAASAQMTNQVNATNTQLQALQQQLLYVQQMVQGVTGIGARRMNPWMRITKWFFVLFFGAICLATIALAPWLLMQAMTAPALVAGGGALIAMIIVAAALAWQG